MVKLQYGELLDVTEAIDVGTPPGYLTANRLSPTGTANDTITVERVRALADEKVPARRIALNVIAYYRDRIGGFDGGEVYRTNLPGLGTLVFGRDEQGWGVSWAVLNKNGEAVDE